VECGRWRWIQQGSEAERDMDAARLDGIGYEEA
jgi:hypothetical protein